MKKKIFVRAVISVFFVCLALLAASDTSGNISLTLCWKDQVSADILYRNTTENGVEINETNFPDAVFRAWLQDASNIDGAGSDGFLSAEELNNIQDITVRGSSENLIRDLKGIEYFTQLVTLSVPYNALTSLDLGNNTNITYLNCSYNRLEKIEITKLSALENLNCEFNYLNKLDLSGNVSLKVLYCRHNLLENLDLSNNTQLVFIETFDNRLTDIDVSILDKLEFLHIDHNRLTILDMSRNLNLKGGGFVVRNNYIQRIILPDIDGFTVYYDDFAEQDPITGYENTLWYADENHTVPVTSDVEADGQTLYAKRIPNSYTVIFSADGASDVPSDVSAIYDVQSSIPENIPLKKGYEFLHWSDDKYSEGTIYAAGQDFLNIAGDKYDGEKIYLYAKWKGIDYKVSFDKNADDAYGTMQDMNAVYGTSYTLDKNVFVRDGYDFDGWSYTRDGNVVFKDCQSFSDLTDVRDGIITLYAVWSENTDTVQQPYLDSLQNHFSQFFRDLYFNEDFASLSEINLNACNEVKNAGKDSSSMSAIVRTAISSMNVVPTKLQRAQQIENTWRSENFQALNCLNSTPVPHGMAEYLNRFVKSAINSADISNLSLLSSLTDKTDREAAAASALNSIQQDVDRLVLFANAADWITEAENITSKPMSQILPEFIPDLENMIEKYSSFSENAKKYIDVQTINAVAERLKLASYKKSSLVKLDDMLRTTDETSLDKQTYDQIVKTVEEAKNAILSAENENGIDELILSASDRVEELKNNNITQDPDVPGGDGQPDGEQDEENNTDGDEVQPDLNKPATDEKDNYFKTSYTVAAVITLEAVVFFAVFLIYKKKLRGKN